MKISTFLVILKQIWFCQISIILVNSFERLSAISVVAQENLLMQELSISVEDSPSYTSSTLPSTRYPDECQLKGHCNMTIDSFLSLGDCLNCYCQCAFNTSTSAQWTKNCCNPGEVWNPNARPNPNTCDLLERIEICTGKSTEIKGKFSHFLILLTITFIINLD